MRCSDADVVGRGAAVVRRAASPPDRCPATATWAASSATTCCPPRSARCARRRSSRRRWPPATPARWRRVCVVGIARAARLPSCAVRGQPVRAPASRRAAVEIELEGRARRRERARAGAALRRSRPGGRRSPPSSRLKLRADERVGAARDARDRATRTALGPTSSTGSAGRCSRSRRCRRRCPGMRVFEILRTALRRAGGRLVLGAEVFAAERDGSRVTRRERTRLGARRALRGAIVRARHAAASPRARSSSTRAGRRTSSCSVCRCAACPAAGEPRFDAEYLGEQPMARVGIAVDGELRAEGAENVLVVGAALPGAAPWREGSGEGIALASGFRAAQVVMAGAGAKRRRQRRRQPHERRCPARAAPRLARPLREVHDLRDHCPVSNVTPLFPGPKYEGPQAERYRIADEPSVDSSVDYCSGCGICSQVLPAGSEDRRDQRPGAQQAQAQKGVPLRDRIITRPTWLGRAGTPVGAAGQLHDRLPAGAACSAEKLLGVHRDAPAPKFAGRRFSRWARKRTEPADRAQDRLLPRLRHRVLRAVGGREGRGDPRAQRLRGRGAQAGLLRAAAAVERPVRRRAQGRAAPRARARAARPRRRTRSSSATPPAAR